jgi:excisionase family DNA binding protein
MTPRKRPGPETIARPLSEITDEDIEHFKMAEAAKFLRISPRTLAGRVARREVPHTRQGRLVLFRRDQILAISQMGDVTPGLHGRRVAA